jgi:hydroxyethylthiazole kinase-like sugar kinase family protein
VASTPPDEVEAALGAARSLTQSSGAVVAISGPTDVVISPDRTTRITGGSPLMPLVVGTWLLARRSGRRLHSRSPIGAADRP